MNFKSLCLLVVAGFGLTACIESPEWTLLYYPDQQSKPSVAESAPFINGYYESIEQCHAKGKGLIRLSGNDNGSYVCGYMCEADDKSLTCQQVVNSEE